MKRARGQQMQRAMTMQMRMQTLSLKTRRTWRLKVKRGRPQAMQQVAQIRTRMPT